MIGGMTKYVQNGTRFIVKQKAPPLKESALILAKSYELAIDNRRGERNRSSNTSSQVEGEVVSITLVHDFKAQVGAVENICPSTNHTTLRVDDRLVEVESVEVEGHRADA